MPIDYCHIEGGNFGDDLNRTMWYRLFPDIDQLSKEIVVAGIGTILSRKPAAKIRQVVLGAGAGGPRVKLNVGNSDIRWVRGPQSATAVGVAPYLGIGDPAWLYSDLYDAFDADRGGAIGFIPHWATWRSFDWKKVAADAGLRGIDARLPPAKVMHKMRSCSRILTESLHGAVFADAMGIPWAPVILSHRFNRFKWEDWCASIYRKFDPLVTDRALVDSVGPVKSIANRIAKSINFKAVERPAALRAVKAASADDAEQVAAQLSKYCADDAHFFFSNPLLVEMQKERMLQVCARFAKDYGLTFRPDNSSPLFRINHTEIKTDFAHNNNSYVWD
ncbi:MAG TPA: polysaccharide pyruvyl transferase family protein [Herbaspirillum sp.]|jgi:hypothetical protein